MIDNATLKMALCSFIFAWLMTCQDYIVTSLNPQNLQNIIKKVAKISIIQISLLMSNLSVKTTV